MTPGHKISNSDRKSLIAAIDSLFIKLELSYHYQFYKIFGTDDKLAAAKKLWAESLKKYSSDCISSAVEAVIQSNDYLPTLTEVHKACLESMGSSNIPTPHEAFIEAQKSSSPRDRYPWTHPIIYWAGKETGWELINSSKNTSIFEAFTKTYSRLAKEMKAGKDFEIILKSSNEIVEPLDIKFFESLRKKHGL